MSDESYVVCTAAQLFRIRYVVPVSSIKDCDPEVFIKDSITCDEIEEFSQLDIGENIIDTHYASESEVLEMFDRDLDYLKNWTKHQKLDYIKLTARIGKHND